MMASNTRLRLMRLSEAAMKLQQQAATDVRNGRENEARELLVQKRKVLQALEKSKSRIEMLDELLAKLNEEQNIERAISKHAEDHDLQSFEEYRPDNPINPQKEEVEEASTSMVIKNEPELVNSLKDVSSYEEFLKILDNQLYPVEEELTRFLRFSSLVLENEDRPKKSKVQQAHEILENVQRIRKRRMQRNTTGLPRIAIAYDTSKRISAKDALDAEYFWNDPFLCDPKSLPKYESPHEFQTKKKRQQQRQPEEAAKRQKLHDSQHAHVPPGQQAGHMRPQLRPGPNQPTHHFQHPGAAGSSHHYGKPWGPSGIPSRYPPGGNPGGGYNPGRGGHNGCYSSGPYPPQGRGAPYAASGMPGQGPRGGGSGYGVGAPNYPQGGLYRASDGGRGSDMNCGNRNQQY